MSKNKGFRDECNTHFLSNTFFHKPSFFRIIKQRNVVHTFLTVHDTNESTVVLHTDPSPHMYQYNTAAVAVLCPCLSVSNTVTYMKGAIQAQCQDCRPHTSSLWAMKDNLAPNTHSLYICKCWTVDCDRMGILLRLGSKGTNSTPIPIIWINQP